MEIYGFICLCLCLAMGASEIHRRRKPMERRLSRREKIDMIKKSHAYITDLKNLRPGQTMPNYCAYSKHGCCADQKTFAEGKYGMSCAVKLCIDENVGYCYFKKMRKRLYCGERMSDSRKCPYSCGDCRPPAPPIKRCLRRNPAFGCCWDGMMAIGRYGRGCRLCLDVHKHPCALFNTVAGGCESGSYGIRSYMLKFCPLTCGFCEGHCHTCFQYIQNSQGSLVLVGMHLNLEGKIIDSNSSELESLLSYPPNRAAFKRAAKKLFCESKGEWRHKK